MMLVENVVVLHKSVNDEVLLPFKDHLPILFSQRTAFEGYLPGLSFVRRQYPAKNWLPMWAVISLHRQLNQSKAQCPERKKGRGSSVIFYGEGNSQRVGSSFFEAFHFESVNDQMRALGQRKRPLARIGTFRRGVSASLGGIRGDFIRFHREVENEEGNDLDNGENRGQTNQSLFKQFFSSVVALFLSGAASAASGALALCTSVWRRRGEGASALGICAFWLGMIGSWFLFGCSFSMAIWGCPWRWLWGVGACASYAA
jgi:hypothetical protein